MKKEKFGLDPTKYDKESYKFKYMLDEFKDIFNNKIFDFYGSNIVKKNSIDYLEKCLNKEESKKKFYQKNFSERDLDKICQDYLTGLVWVFEYYFNKTFDKKSSGYSYPYKYSPFLSDFSNFLNNNRSKVVIKSLNKVKDNLIPNEHYLTPLEHYFFVQHYNYDKTAIDQKYHHVVNEIIKWNKFPIGKLGKIVKDILEKQNNYNINNIVSQSEYIDCMGVSYLNKCSINGIIDNLPDLKNYIKYIKKFNLI